MKKALAAIGIALGVATAPASVKAWMFDVRYPDCFWEYRGCEKQSAKADFENYHVRRKDTLWDIAKSVYGAPSKYRDLAAINQIPSPDKIYVGQIIKVPILRSVNVTDPVYIYRSCPATEQCFPISKVASGTEEYCNLLGPDCIMAYEGYCVPRGWGNCDNYQRREVK